MEAAGQVVREVRGLPTWAGAAVLFDGTDPEQAQSTKVALGCPRCGATIHASAASSTTPHGRADLEALVAATPRIVEAAGLHRSARMEPHPLHSSIGLPASMELARCEACGADLGIITAHGEHQPGRYVTTLQGIVPVRRSPPPRTGWGSLRRGERAAVVAAAAAALAATVVLAWAHVAAWRAWQQQRSLDRTGVLASAEVIEADAATDRPRSVDRFSVVVRFEGPDGPVQGSLDVEEATYQRAQAGSLEVRYDPEDPSRFVAAQDGKGLTLVLIVGLVDVALVATIAWERRSGRRARRAQLSRAGGTPT